LGHLVPKARIVLRRHPIEQQFKGRPSQADGAEHGWRAPSEHLLPLVDLELLRRFVTAYVDGVDASETGGAHLKLDQQVMNALRKDKAPVVPA
jgi:hypothetical protein